MEGVRNFRIRGQDVEVPDSEMQDFMRAAQENGDTPESVRQFRVRGASVTVPVSELDAFHQAAQENGDTPEEVHTVALGGQRVDVPQGEAADFIRAYNAAPEYAGERAERNRKIARELDARTPWEDRLGPVAAGAVTLAKEQVNPFGGTATPLENRAAAAANVGRAVARAPVTLTEKALDAAGFAARGVEMLSGMEGKSGFREGLENVKRTVAGWRERNLGDVGDTGDWGVTAAGMAANAIAEAWSIGGLAAAARVVRGVRATGDAAAAGGRLAQVWQAMKNPSAQSALYGFSQAEQTAAKGEEAGKSKARQMLAGGISGAAETALESVSQVFGIQGQARDALRGAFERDVRQRVANILGEGTTEGLQQLKTGAVEKLAGFDDKTWGQIGLETAQSAALGLIAAGAGEAGNMATLGMTRPSDFERALEDAPNGAWRSAENLHAETRNSGEENGNGQDGQAGTEQAAAGNAGGGGAAAGAPGGTSEEFRAETRRRGEDVGGRLAEVMPPREDGGERIGTEVRQVGGRSVAGLLVQRPDGTRHWDPDPAEMELARYWMYDRVNLPAAPAGTPGRQAGEPQVNASRRAGFDVKPGKSVLVMLGRSGRPYPARVVEVLDDTHVRIRVKSIARAQKNNRAGYADVDVRQLQQWRAAEAKARQEESLKRVPQGERALVRAASKQFVDIIMEGDEFADQEALAAADALGGQRGGVARGIEQRSALARAAAALGIDGYLTDPVERARALPQLEAWMARQRGGDETPAEVWMARALEETAQERDALEAEPFALDSMTPAELEADRERVATAQERVAQRRELEARSAAVPQGTAGDMTGSLPGFEGTSDVPLFTERDGARGDAKSKQLEMMTPDEFKAEAKFAKRHGTKRLVLMVGKYLFPVDEQRNGKLTVSADRIIAQTHQRIIDGQVSRLVIDRADADPNSVASTKNMARERLKTPERYSINAEAAERYGTILPKYYVKEGNTYVYRPEFNSTERDVSRGGAETRREGDVLANVEDGGTVEARGDDPKKKTGKPERIGGVRVAPHTVYNQDSSAGMEGDGRTVKPVVEGLQGIGMDLRDAVAVYRMLRGMLPKIRKTLNGRALGWYTIEGREVELLASIFGLVDRKDTERIRQRLRDKGLDAAAVEKAMPGEVNALAESRMNGRMKRPVKVMVHELAHLIDALPDGALRGRGNILGHIAGLKRFMKEALPREPGAPSEVSASERARLMAEAERQMEREIGSARTIIEEIRKEETVYRELPVSAEDVKALLGLDGKERTPELFGWFARQDDATKKDVLRAAMKGMVDERARAASVRAETTGTVTGTREVRMPGYTRADVRKRYRELLRQAAAELMLIERADILSEARSAIPKWRGVEAMERYFEKPEEMYAEVTAMLLADPQFMERELPTAFRAWTAYMGARPAAAQAYTDWLNDKTSGVIGRKHVSALKAQWTAAYEDDLAKYEKDVRTADARQGWQGVRFYLDRRYGPVYMAVRRAVKIQKRDIARRLKAGEMTEEAAVGERKALDTRSTKIVAGVKTILKGANTIRGMMADVNGRVKGVLDAAGLAWDQLAEYAFHNRVRLELDGRAAAFGWQPETSGKRLEEMRRDMTPEQWAALERAWTAFRGIYERTVVEMEGMREMLGEELHDLIRKNVHYVAFAHVPTAEDLKARTEERAAADKGLPGGATAFDLLAAEFEARAGNAGAKIYPLTGSFDPVRNPLTATLEKAARLMDAVYRNRVKMQLRDLLMQTPDSGYREAETIRTENGGSVVRDIDNGRVKTVHYMEDGKVRGFVTDKWVAEAFDHKGVEQVQQIGMMLKVNNLLSALLTRFRPAFFEPAYAKDKQAAVANIKGLWRSPLASIPGIGELPTALFTRYIPEPVRDYMAGNPALRWLMNPGHLEYWEGAARRAAIIIQHGNFEAELRKAAAAEAAGNARLGERIRGDVAAARHALGENVLMAMQRVALPGQGLSDFDRLMARHGVREQTVQEAANWWNSTGGKLIRIIADWYSSLGEIRENTTKIATLMYLDSQTDMTRDQKQIAVSEWGGSPDFSERGVGAGYVEFAGGAFINARKEALVRGVKAFADHPADYMVKKLTYTVTPAVIRRMISSGFFLGLMNHWIPDPEEREKSAIYRWLRWARTKMSFASQYLQRGYICVPLPIDAGDNAAVILTMPMDESEMVWADFAATAFDSLLADQPEVIRNDPDPWVNYSKRLFANLSPFGTTDTGPFLSTVIPWFKTYALGMPTYDSFRGRNILTDDELAARLDRPDALQVLLGNSWNALGGSIVKPWERDKPEPDKMIPLESFLKLPLVGPVMGRWIRVVRNGQEQIAEAIAGDDKQQRVLDRLDAKNIYQKSLKAGEMLLPEYRDRILSNPYISDYYFDLVRKGIKESGRDVFLDAARKADNPDTALRLLDTRTKLIDAAK